MKDKMLFDGKFVKLLERTINNIKREIVQLRGIDGVAAVIFNKNKDKILLVKQERLAIKENDKTTWEIPAGMTDVENENYKDCLIREIEEETNLDINELEFLIKYYPIIGCCDHEISIYTTQVENDELNRKLTDNDVTQIDWFDFNEINQMIIDGKIKDGKTLIAFYQVILPILKNDI